MRSLLARMGPVPARRMLHLLGGERCVVKMNAGGGRGERSRCHAMVGSAVAKVVDGTV